MAEWPDPAPLDDLFQAAADQDQTLHVIALRGYIKLCSQSANRASSVTAAMLAKALPIARCRRRKDGRSRSTHRIPLQGNAEYRRDLPR